MTRYLHRYWLVLVDLVLFTVCLILAYSLRFGLSIPSDDSLVAGNNYALQLQLLLPWIILTHVLLYAAFKVYGGILKYSGIRDLTLLFVANFVQLVLWSLVNVFLDAQSELGSMPQRLIGESGETEVLRVPWIIIVCYVLLAALTTSLIRFLPRAFSEQVGRPKGSEEFPRTLIIGAGNSADALLRDLARSGAMPLKPVCAVSSTTSNVGLRLHGVPVVGTLDKISAVLEENDIEQVLIALDNPEPAVLRQVVGECESAGITFRVVPSLNELSEGRYEVSSVRTINIEDLLGREPVLLDLPENENYLKGKRIVLTGAGGSIGSELSRQVASAEPKEMILFGKGENSIFDITEELRLEFKDLKITPFIGDVRDRTRVDLLFRETRPDIVFHAAAHKHVPLMEDAPDEAVKNNILGTANLATAADATGVEHFVFISSDKAVSPVSVMGATKRYAERYLQSMAQVTSMHISIVRFGNVMGSRGSVIPAFRRQIAAGGPVKVTHPDAMRYFMTIPEAASLVIQSGRFRDTSGSIFLLEMGDAVKIGDLARNMITLSGFRPEVDIAIEYTGLRPGEKLVEELLVKGENLAQTSVSKIYVAPEDKARSWDDVANDLLIFEDILEDEDDLVLLGYLSKVVPGYNPSVIEGEDIEIPQAPRARETFVEDSWDPESLDVVAKDLEEEIKILKVSDIEDEMDREGRIIGPEDQDDSFSESDATQESNEEESSSPLAEEGEKDDEPISEVIESDLFEQAEDGDEEPPSPDDEVEDFISDHEDSKTDEPVENPEIQENEVAESADEPADLKQEDVKNEVDDERNISHEEKFTVEPSDSNEEGPTEPEMDEVLNLDPKSKEEENIMSERDVSNNNAVLIMRVTPGIEKETLELLVSQLKEKVLRESDSLILLAEKESASALPEGVETVFFDDRAQGAIMNEAVSKAPEAGILITLTSESLLKEGAIEAIIEGLDAETPLVYTNFEENQDGEVTLVEPHDHDGCPHERFEFGTVIAYRMSWIKDVGGIRDDLSFAWEYDLHLKLMEQGAFKPIRQVLYTKFLPSKKAGKGDAVYSPGMGPLGGFSYVFYPEDMEKEVTSVFEEALKRRNAWLDHPTAEVDHKGRDYEVMVTVVTPILNRIKYIENAIRKVQANDFDSWELIVVDNGSTDGTIEKVEELAKEDDRIRLIHGTGGTIASALNEGIRNARGKYIGQMDSDDEYATDCLKEMVNKLESNPKCGLAISYYRLMDENGVIIEDIPPVTHKGYSRNQIVRRDGAGATRFFARAVLEEFGLYDEEHYGNFGEDYDMVVKTGEKYDVERVHKVLYHYRRHADNTDVTRDPAMKYHNKNHARQQALKRRIAINKELNKV